MKKLLIHIIVLIVITAAIFFNLSKNFPTDIVEINFDSIVTPEQMSKAVSGLSLYDYLNIYDISSIEKNARLYSGNINILLKDKNIESIGITLKDDEVIMGDRFMRENFNYNLLGEIYSSKLGEFNVSTIIKNDDNIYYRKLDAINGASIKKQVLYLSLMSTKRRVLDYKNTVISLKYYGINATKSIYYADVANFFLKFLILLILMALTIVFLKAIAYTKKLTAQITERHKLFSYDLDTKEFIFNADNFKLILKLLMWIVLEIAIVFAVLRLAIVFLNTYISYEVDFTSLRSITDAIREFFSFMKYYVNNGFTNISLAIMKCIVIYMLTATVMIAVNLSKLLKKIKKD